MFGHAQDTVVPSALQLYSMRCRCANVTVRWCELIENALTECCGAWIYAEAITPGGTHTLGHPNSSTQSREISLGKYRPPNYSRYPPQSLVPYLINVPLLSLASKIKWRRQARSRALATMALRTSPLHMGLLTAHVCTLLFQCPSRPAHQVVCIPQGRLRWQPALAIRRLAGR